MTKIYYFSGRGSSLCITRKTICGTCLAARSRCPDRRITRSEMIISNPAAGNTALLPAHESAASVHK